MALVAYDYSDSESENESEDEGDKNNDKPASVCELFSTLPQPKQQPIIVEEEDDDFLEKPKKNGVKQPVKISIPALSNFDSVEEEPPKKIITSQQQKATGLFAVLPTPKCVPVEYKNPKFDAKLVKQKNLVPRTVTKAAAVAATKRQHDSDDEEVGSCSFFSFTESTKINPTPAVSSSLGMQIDSAKPVKDMSGKSNSFFSDFVAKATKPPTPEPEIMEDLEKNAVEELCGKGKRQKKAKKNGIQFIDINADDVMPDPREWRTKALTEEQPQPAVKKGEEPSLQSRRKHQITYLAYQAKVNEQELKNQWALNRMTRKQTQAKYGF